MPASDSGSKLVCPGDDPAGLGTATQINAEIDRLGAASSNVGNAISFVQTQVGYLEGVANATDRMEQLCILAEDATKTDSDRALYDAEYRNLASYVSSVGSKQFNGVPLFSANPFTVTTDGDGGTLTMPGIDWNYPPYYGYMSPYDDHIDTVDNAQWAYYQFQRARPRLSSDLATLGAYMARLNSTASELTVSQSNLTAANSRIQDVDVAQESTNYARANILVQAGTTMLAQANQIPQSVLKLLQ